MGLTYVEGEGEICKTAFDPVSGKKEKRNFLVMNKTFWYMFSSNIGAKGHHTLNPTYSFDSN